MYNIPGITGITGLLILSVNFINLSGDIPVILCLLKYNIPGIIMRKLNLISDIPGIRGYRR